MVHLVKLSLGWNGHFPWRVHRYYFCQGILKDHLGISSQRLDHVLHPGDICLEGVFIFTDAGEIQKIQLQHCLKILR